MSVCGVGVSVGVGLKGGGVSPTGGAHASFGKSGSRETRQVNTRVTGTGDVTLESGRDTRLEGAVVDH